MLADRKYRSGTCGLRRSTTYGAEEQQGLKKWMDEDDDAGVQERRKKSEGAKSKTSALPKAVGRE